MTPDTPDVRDERPMSPEETREREIDALLASFQDACEIAIASASSSLAKDATKERAILRNDLRARLLAARSSGEPSGPEAPTEEDDQRVREYSERAMHAEMSLRDARERLAKVFPDEEWAALNVAGDARIAASRERLAASRSSRSGSPRTGCATCDGDGYVLVFGNKKQTCTDCIASSFASPSGSPPASPLSEEEIALVNELRYSAARAKVNVVLEVAESAALLAIIDRLAPRSAAPAPGEGNEEGTHAR